MTSDRSGEKRERIERVAVYLGASVPNDPDFVQATVDLGKYLASHGMTLIFGGSSMGLMKLMAETVLGNGGKAVGVISKNIPLKYLHPGLTDSVVTENLAERKAEMIRRADAIIAMPGSFGTFDELFDAAALKKVPLGGNQMPIGVLNVKGFYDPLVKLIENSVKVGFATPQQGNIIRAGKTPEELFQLLEEDFYHRKNTADIRG